MIFRISQLCLLRRLSEQRAVSPALPPSAGLAFFQPERAHKGSTTEKPAIHCQVSEPAFDISHWYGFLCLLVNPEHYRAHVLFLLLRAKQRLENIDRRPSFG